MAACMCTSIQSRKRSNGENDDTRAARLIGVHALRTRHRASNCTTVIKGKGEQENEASVSERAAMTREQARGAVGGARAHEHALLVVRFLYMMRCPHDRHRMGSRGLMSFELPQSARHNAEH